VTILKLPLQRMNGLNLLHDSIDSRVCDGCRLYLPAGSDVVRFSTQIHIPSTWNAQGVYINLIEGTDYLGRPWRQLSFCSFECAEDYLGFTR